MHYFSLFPEIRIVVASQKGLDLLAQHGHLAVIDASFELADLGFILVTILVLASGGVLVPAVWFITDTVHAPNFEWFLRFAQNAGAWQMAVCFSDFEPHLRAAIAQVFPSCLVLGDAWHFFHDNHKWVRANNGLDYVEAVDQSLHILWAAPTEQEFTTSLAGFINYWATQWPPYAAYFSKQWMESVTAGEWALFGRPQGLFTSHL